jgi:hypothetical protein
LRVSAATAAKRTAAKAQAILTLEIDVTDVLTAPFRLHFAFSIQHLALLSTVALRISAPIDYGL